CASPSNAHTFRPALPLEAQRDAVATLVPDEFTLLIEAEPFDGDAVTSHAAAPPSEKSETSEIRCPASDFFRLIRLFRLMTSVSSPFGGRRQLVPWSR